MKFGKAIVLIGALILLLVVLRWHKHRQLDATADRILLLLPDDTNLSDPKVTVWLDAANEEGLHLVAVHDSEFMRPFEGETQCAGLILPDSVHLRVSDLLVGGIESFVAKGGKLMLVYDAGTLSTSGRYAPARSRFSNLAGVDYALYDKLGDKTIQWSSLTGMDSIVRQLEIPPGKYYPFEAPARPSSESSSVSFAQDDFEVQLKRYKYGELDYPSFVTAGDYSGKVLFHSSAGLVVGEHSYQQGSVLFANLPLGYLTANTDGLLLHAFLGYFADHVLEVPRLMSVPDGVGGLVLNWHVDSNAAIKPLQELNSWSLLRQGPYSIHITAGPDAFAIGDKQGFNVEHNPVSQKLIRQYEASGNEIGSHGGWIHNYFAEHVETDDPLTLQPFLELNKSALERVVGKPVVEYSAPNGDQPPWITRWLESHGFVAYYFTGDSGMAPTQGYRDGAREGKSIWAFPIVHLDRAASFEEMTKEKYPSPEVERWLRAVADFTVTRHTVRLVYFHPPGILPYRSVFDHWLQATAQLKAEGRFRWYTMTELANFLNSRTQVKWEAANQSGKFTVDATHPESLDHETWSFPAARFAEPAVLAGAASVIRNGDDWLVIAGAGKNLRFQTAMLTK